MLKSTWNRETRKVKGSNMNMRQRRGHETERVLITRIEGPEIHRNLENTMDLFTSDRMSSEPMLFGLQIQYRTIQTIKCEN